MCSLLQVKSLYESELDLDLLPHHYTSVLKKFRSIFKIMLYGTPQLFFDNSNGGNLKFANSKLVKVQEVEERGQTKSFLFLMKSARAGSLVRFTQINQLRKEVLGKKFVSPQILPLQLVAVRQLQKAFTVSQPCIGKMGDNTIQP